jgi:DNA-binding MarR family transcriptional regulator
MSDSNSTVTTTNDDAYAGLPADRVRSVVRVMVRLRRFLERTENGLTLTQYHLLTMVGSGGERSARLAEKLTVRKPTLTATADGLVAAGLLEREAEAGDRRVVRLTVTEAGVAAMERADAELASVLAPLLAEVADPDALFDVFDAIGAALDQRAEKRHAQHRGGK